MNFYEAETLEERIKIMHNLSQRFLNRASEIDETGIFPFANISDLKNPAILL